jgi:hypothetical protein
MCISEYDWGLVYYELRDGLEWGEMEGSLDDDGRKGMGGVSASSRGNVGFEDFSDG